MSTQGDTRVLFTLLVDALIHRIEQNKEDVDLSTLSLARQVCKDFPDMGDTDIPMEMQDAFATLREALPFNKPKKNRSKKEPQQDAPITS